MCLIRKGMMLGSLLGVLAMVGGCQMQQRMRRDRSRWIRRRFRLTRPCRRGIGRSRRLCIRTTRYWRGRITRRCGPSRRRCMRRFSGSRRCSLRTRVISRRGCASIFRRRWWSTNRFRRRRLRRRCRRWCLPVKIRWRKRVGGSPCEAPSQTTRLKVWEDEHIRSASAYLSIDWS